MAFIETKHTRAVFEKIKKELSAFLIIVSIVSMIAFSVYYGYLIYNNLESIIHLIAYIILFALVIISFIVELVLKTKKTDKRKEKREKKERKRIITIFTKSLKYLAKGSTIILALIGLKNISEIEMSLVLTIASSLLLLIQLLSEFVISFVNRYIDYFMLSLQMDLDESFVGKFVFKEDRKLRKLEEKIYDAKGESPYTTQEIRIKDMIKENANKLKKENKEEYKSTIQKYKQELKEQNRINISIKRQEKILAKYNVSVNEAKSIIDIPEKIDEYLIKASKLLSKMPEDKQSLQYIPIFISVISHYIKGDYRDFSIKSILALLGLIIYYVSPFDIIPDSLPVIGYLDEAFLVEKCLEQVDDELEKFMLWIEKKESNQRIGITNK